MEIIIGADHAGFELKEKLKKNLKKYKITDIGAKKYDKNDDYPDYAHKLAKKINKNKGILICGTGAGMCMAANRHKNIRAVVGLDEYEVEMSRKHNDANVLCLRARNFPYSKTLKITKLWLNTKFTNEKRHVRRIKKL